MLYFLLNKRGRTNQVTNGNYLNMANESAASIKLISECFVRPKHEVEQSKEPYHLAPTDLCFLPLHHLQKGLLYTKPPTFNIESFLDDLKSALSLALLHFYPLAGQFNTVEDEDQDACWIYLDCNKGPGARLLHATCTAVSITDILASGPESIPVIRSFFDLGEDVINYDGHTRALLCVQVTEITDGIFIGFAMNHAVVDGTSFWHFVSTMSEIFTSMHETNKKNVFISQPPIIQPIFPDGYDPIFKLQCSAFKKFMAQFRVGIDPNLTEKIFHITSSSINKLKAQANSECYDLKFSSFQSLSALVWRSIVRAQNSENESETTCTVIADARQRFRPPMSSHHFGNLVLPETGSCKMGELLDNGLGYAANLVNQTIARIDEQKVRDRCRRLLETLLGPECEPLASSLAGSSGAVVLGGSMRFNIYRAEFGLGKAVAVRTGYSAKTNGKVTVNKGCNGEGSVDLEISLSPQAMSALQQDQEFMSFVS